MTTTNCDIETVSPTFLLDASNQYYDLLRRSTKPCSNSRHKTTGRFYTPVEIYVSMTENVAQQINLQESISIIDPFAGDGRLVIDLVKKILARDSLSIIKEFCLKLVDIEPQELETAKFQLEELSRSNPQVMWKIEVDCADTFAIAQTFHKYDICITNPPWVILKYSSRVAERLLKADRKEYEDKIKSYIAALKCYYPLLKSQAGFSQGINLSRLGMDVSVGLLKSNAILAIVLPATFFADQVSEYQRKVVFEQMDLKCVSYFPPECRLFDNVDQSCISMIVWNRVTSNREFVLRTYTKELTFSRTTWNESLATYLSSNKYVIPLEYSSDQVRVLQKFDNFPTLAEQPDIHFTREMDETRITEKLSDSGKNLFVKGYMIDQYAMVEPPSKYTNDEIVKVPPSATMTKIVWRDVSRASQKRRLHATILPPGYIAGNSLGVLYLDSSDRNCLLWLLGIMNSYVFEFQIRSSLISNHVPAGILKNQKIPDGHQKNIISTFVEKLLDPQFAPSEKEIARLSVEILIAIEYGLSYPDFMTVLSMFSIEKDEMEKLSSMALEKMGLNSHPLNHYSAKLSDLDKLIISYVPQGGNWKNIPESVPSQRLANIRKGFAEGKGSRSTYYGRLREDAPAYTISTYFGRPGNGCNIHYSQNRTLSQREAARIQGFPDNFEFLGSKVAVNDQIGNAVPPILAFQLASALKKHGIFVDLFAGAGGLALGFVWAGWMPIISNDINEAAMKTHAHNISERTICGDITSEDVVNEIVRSCVDSRKEFPRRPLFVLGGPPCQGFSTANCNRSTNDQRNWLFTAYVRILKEIKPDGFIFENVTGILNFEGGRFFEMIKKSLNDCVEKIKPMRLNCAEYGIPQRRERVIILGGSESLVDNFTLSPITTLSWQNAEPSLFPMDAELHPSISVKDALDDLPVISDAEDGSSLPYRFAPQTIYQKFMRGEINIGEYLRILRNGKR